MVRSLEKAKILPKDVTLFEGDLSLFSDETLQLPACDILVHLAGVVAAPSTAEYQQINYTAVQQLLDCIERQEWKPKRLLFASSLAAAGPSPKGTAWTEKDPLSPIDPYGQAKAQAETLLPKASFPTTTFRPPIVFGPEDNTSLPLYQFAKKGLGFTIGRTQQQLSFVDVRDAVSSIVTMAQDKRTGHFVYYIGHHKATTDRQIWDAMGQAFEKKVHIVPIPKTFAFSLMKLSTWGSTVFRFHNKFDSKQYRQMVAPGFVCNSQAIEKDLGWTAQYGLVACLQNAVEGYRSAGYSL